MSYYKSILQLSSRKRNGKVVDLINSYEPSCEVINDPNSFNIYKQNTTDKTKVCVFTINYQQRGSVDLVYFHSTDGPYLYTVLRDKRHLLLEELYTHCYEQAKVMNFCRNDGDIDISSYVFAKYNANTLMVTVDFRSKYNEYYSTDQEICYTSFLFWGLIEQKKMFFPDSNATVAYTVYTRNLTPTIVWDIDIVRLC